MTVSSTLTLSQATATLQLALAHAGCLDEVAERIVTDVYQQGNEPVLLGLPGWAQEGIDHLRRPDGMESHERQIRRSLAYFAAEIGKREALQGMRTADLAAQMSPRAAIDEIFSRLPSVFAPEPKPAFMAGMKNPADGFRQFLTEDGTEVAFFPAPESLGPPWDDFIRGHWSNGLGLVIFRSRTTDAAGMIFLHSLGRVEWTKLPFKPAWQASGGSMAFSDDALIFAQALERVVDKGVAMTWKWRAVDDSLRNGVLNGVKPTGLGGSKGIVLYGRAGDAREKAFRVYAGVLRILGVTLTGSDEGVDAADADFLAGLAPFNIYGTMKSRYNGRKPTEYTAQGIFEVLKAVSTLGENLQMRKPILAVGYGGIGRPLVRRLLKEKFPVAGVVETDPAKLVTGGANGAPLYRDLTRNGWTSWLAWPYWRAQGVRYASNLAEVIAATPEARVLTPNGGPHPVTFDVAQALIEGGIEAVAGAANNQHGLDRFGSPLPMAWILQAAGIFNPADFVANRLGAIAVVSDAVGMRFPQDLSRQVEKAGDSTREDHQAFLKGIPPFVYRWEKAVKAWRAIVASGLGLGGV